MVAAGTSDGRASEGAAPLHETCRRRKALYLHLQAKGGSQRWRGGWLVNLCTCMIVILYLYGRSVLRDLPLCTCLSKMYVDLDLVACRVCVCGAAAPVMPEPLVPLVASL